jgi:hypothetical protein
MGLFQPTTPLLPVFPRACLASLTLSHVEGLAPLALCTQPVLKQGGAEGPAPSGASGSAAYVTFELSPQPAGSRLPRRPLAGLREESTPRTSSAQPERTLREDKNKSVRATGEVGRGNLPVLIPTPAGWFGGSLPALFLAADTLLQALKTNLLEPFLIASQTTVVNAQLTQNQQHPIF